MALEATGVAPEVAFARVPVQEAAGNRLKTCCLRCRSRGARIMTAAGGEDDGYRAEDREASDTRANTL